jgi:hypothetical protein
MHLNGAGLGCRELAVQVLQQTVFVLRRVSII